MNDPKRWLDEGGGASFDERELLRAGQGAALPSGARRRIWLGIATSAASIGAVSEAAGAIGGAGAGKGVLSVFAGSALAKGVVAIAIVGGASAGVAALRGSKTADDRAVVSAMSAKAPVTGSREEVRPFAAEDPNEVAVPRATAVPSDDSTSRAVNVPPPVKVSSNGSKSAGAHRAKPRLAPAVPSKDDETRAQEPTELRAASRLREESAAILAAREALLAGRPSDSLRQLERARAEFPGGALAEEREALRVRALIAAGDRAGARDRGDAFLRAFPKSPHAAEIRALLGL
ncbi:MAG: hypothetical protein ABW133_21000 [Polyangiaceae bacterium]